MPRWTCTHSKWKPGAQTVCSTEAFSDQTPSVGIALCTHTHVLTHSTICQPTQPSYEEKGQRAPPQFCKRENRGTGRFRGWNTITRSGTRWDPGLLSSGLRLFAPVLTSLQGAQFKSISDVLYHLVFTMALRNRYRYPFPPPSFL